MGVSSTATALLESSSVRSHVIRKKTDMKSRWLEMSTVATSHSTSERARPVCSNAAPSGIVPASSSSDDESSEAMASPGRRRPGE